MRTLEGKRVLITGGTGSLGQVLLRRILSGELGHPKKVIIFSRDEAKQHELRIRCQHRRVATDEIIYRDADDILDFRIGDVRDFHSVAGVLRGVDVVFNAAALKQVPTCEYFPYQAVLTNIAGPENIVRAIEELRLSVETVVGISTDKACKPVNVMGMTKAIQERLFIQANMRCPDTTFSCVRYGNVLSSRGSVIPLFHDQIRNGGPVTITHTGMTRFLMSLDQAVDTVFEAYRVGGRGETFIPRVPAALVTDIATVLIGDRTVPTTVTGIRPGEKLHEILISEEEMGRTREQGVFFVLGPMLREVAVGAGSAALDAEYSSAHALIDRTELETLLRGKRLMVEDTEREEGDLLR